MNHYRLYKNLNMQPFLEEINLNDDWIEAQSSETGRLYTNSNLNKRIDLIQPFRNPDDPESKNNIGGSTYTGVIPSKVFHKYKIASSFLGWFGSSLDLININLYSLSIWVNL